MSAHRAQDLAQKYSQSTVFHEAKDRLLMVPVAPMAGAMINTSSSSSSLMARDRPPLQQQSPQAAGSQQTLVISMQSQSAHSSNNNLEGSNSNSNGLEGESAAIDNNNNNNNNSETEAVEDKRTTRGPITHDKGARGRWTALFERACSLLQRTSRATGTSVSSGTGTVASALVAAAVQSQQLLQAKAASKQGKGKASSADNTSTSSSAAACASCSSSDLAEAMAILEEAAGLPSIVNAPGECFAETMRAVLGELLVAVADARAWDAEVSDGKTLTRSLSHATRHDTIKHIPILHVSHNDDVDNNLLGTFDCNSHHDQNRHHLISVLLPLPAVASLLAVCPSLH